MISVQGMEELQVHMNIVWFYLSKIFYYVYELFFLFPFDALYSVDLNNKHLNKGNIWIAEEN